MAAIGFWVMGAPMGAQAQGRGPKSEVKAIVGFYGDDEDVHPSFGGAYTYYVASQAYGELEVLYLAKSTRDDFHGVAWTPTFGADFRHPPAGFQPFGRVGVSFSHWWGTLPPDTPDTPRRPSKITAVRCGIRIGFKVHIDRFFLSPEFGIGENVHWTLNLGAGYIPSFR